MSVFIVLGKAMVRDGLWWIGLEGWEKQKSGWHFVCLCLQFQPPVDNRSPLNMTVTTGEDEGLALREMVNGTVSVVGEGFDLPKFGEIDNTLFLQLF